MLFDPNVIIEELISNYPFTYLVMESNIVSGAITTTNALGWSFSSYENLEVEFESDIEISFSVNMIFAGQQDEDRMMCGTKVAAQVTGLALYTNDAWEIEDYTVQDTHTFD